MHKYSLINLKEEPTRKPMYFTDDAKYPLMTNKNHLFSKHRFIFTLAKINTDIAINTDSIYWSQLLLIEL